MTKLLLRAAVVAAILSPLPFAQGPGHPISGIQTSDYGTGSGFLQPMVASYGWNGATGSLEIKIQAFSCCNTYYQGFYLLYGQAPPMPPAFSLPSPPFFAGSLLYALPDAITNYLPGNAASLPIPANPVLVGQTFYVQVIGEWFTTIGFTTDFGISQGTKVTFV